MTRSRFTATAVTAGLACLALAPSACASFGLQSLRLSIESTPLVGGQPVTPNPPDIQAGSHPFQVTISFTLKTTTDAHGQTIPDGALKDLRMELPPGMIGNLAGLPQCANEAFENSVFLEQGCPASTQIGTLTLNTTVTNVTLPVFNLQPPPGVPARLGVFALLLPVVMDVSVRTGGDYGLTVEQRNLAQFLGTLGATLTLWGVPADKAHDPLRGSCLNLDGSSSGECPSDAPRQPFLTLPGACGSSLQATVSVDSWEQPGAYVPVSASFGDAEGRALGLSGCGRLDFSPTVQVRSESSEADAPAALAVKVELPQSENPDGLAEAIVRDAVVTLPPGISIDPAAADGLGACQAPQISLGDGSVAQCPDSSRIGAVTIDTPLLTDPLRGSVYLAAPYANPFGGMLAVYIVAQGDGVTLKFGGRLDADPDTGQLTLSLQGVPELPFRELTLLFEGGPRAPLAMPATCGTFEATGWLAPYSAPPASPASAGGGSPDLSQDIGRAAASSQLAVDRGCDGGFAPSFSAGATTSVAGHDTGFVLRVGRADGEQDIDRLSTTLPPGLLARLGSVALCPEAQAAAGSCPASSMIGKIAIAAGAGSHPLYLGGRVFLTGAYGGVPFGLSIVVPAVAGPFDLGTIAVRASVSVDAHDAHMTIATDSFPRILQGIPLRIRAIQLSIDRPGFMVTPTACAPQEVSGVALSVAGTGAFLSNPFLLGGCAALPFSPRVSAFTSARVGRAYGAALTLEIRNPAGVEANIRSVSIGMPAQFSPRLSAIQGSCAQSAFRTDPASCPPSAVVGAVTLRTPVLPVPLSGPAYLLSGGQGGQPGLALVLQADGVALRLFGSLHLSAGGKIAASFPAMPDAPISSFTLRLPKGPGSVFGVNFLGKRAGSLCGRALRMPIVLAAQNGARIERSTRVAVVGCPAHGSTGHGHLRS